jgi:Ca2+/Na+ antiporter
MKYNLIILGIVGIILKLTVETSPSIFVEYSVLSLLILLVITFIAKKSNTQQKWKM